MLTDVEIAWFAGLLEGEGSFGYYPDKRCPSTGKVIIQFESTDKDIIEKVHSLFGGRYWDSDYPSKPSHYKKSWRWAVTSKKEVREIIKMVYPYLGNRRKTKCDEVLEKIGGGQ